MKINSKKEKKYSTEVENNDQKNDSIFQEEGDYFINEMPKYKYEIKVIHESPNRLNRAKTPDRMESSTRFTIINRPEANFKNYRNNIYINKNHYARNTNNSNINQLYKFKSIRTGPTIRFYSGNSSIQNERNNTFEKNFKYKKKHKRYNNKKIKYNNNYCYITNNDYGYNYIIEIFPKTPCICQEEIDKIINEYFKEKKLKKFIYNCGDECDICNRKKRNIYNENIIKRDNNYYYSKISSPNKKYFKEIKIVKPINKVYYPKRTNTPLNYNISKNNYYYTSNINTKRIVQNKYNNNIYIETSNISSPKTKNNQLKKIKISKKNKNNNISQNYSFISADNTPNYKNISPNDNSFINAKKYNKRNYLSPYYSKSQNLSNNLYNTTKSNRRKSSNIMINKSSEKYEQIKVIPIGQKINPLIVKKSVEKPKKETIINEDGTTTNVIRQTSVITSIESKPIVNNNSNSKDENLVKECVTKIYTTLTKNVNENENEINNKINEDENINNNANKDNNKIKVNKVVKVQNEEVNNLNIDNYNKENNNINCNNKENNNINSNKIIINNPNNENKNIINNNLENNNDFLKHKNNNSSFNYSSIYSNNINDQNEHLNINRLNEIVKYIKYLYYRCTNLTSYEVAKEESLSNYFLKLNYDEKVAVLNNLKDGNLENKKIYNKLISILDENYVELINDEEDEKLYKNKQGNILNKK